MKKSINKKEAVDRSLKRKDEILSNPNLTMEIFNVIDFLKQEFSEIDSVSSAFTAILALLIGLEEYGFLKINEKYSGRPKMK